MNNNKHLLSVIALAVMVCFTGCKKDEEVEDNLPEVTVSNFTVTIAENPEMGQVLGTVTSSIKNAAAQRFFFLEEHQGIGGHVSINSDGELTVSNPAFFDYEQVQFIVGDASVEISNNFGEVASANFSVTINITDVDETPPPPALNVQQRLEGGETPLDIYNSDNTLLDSLYGKTYLGGLIFYFDVTTGDGLAAAPNDQSTGMVWDPNSAGLVATTATSTSLGDGAQNTFVITTSIGAGSYAARECGDLVLNNYSGWFLPTLDELELMDENLHAKGYGSFQNAKYWTSSELTAGSAWSRDFSVSSGQIAVSNLKIDLFAVRAARAF